MAQSCTLKNLPIAPRLGMRKLRIRVVAPLALCITAAHAPIARAESFDLDCRMLSDDGQPKLSLPAEHYQIDRKNGEWCREKCDKVEVIHHDANEILTLVDTTFYGDRKLIEYRFYDNQIVENFGEGKSHAYERKYICTKQLFGGLQPYLAAEVQPIGMLRLEPKDFFTDSKGKKQGGMVGFEIAVDPSGTLKNCAIAQSSGNRELDDYTCTMVMQRLRVKPARDRAGNPIDGIYRNRIHWAMWD